MHDQIFKFQSPLGKAKGDVARYVLGSDFPYPAPDTHFQIKFESPLGKVKGDLQCIDSILNTIQCLWLDYVMFKPNDLHVLLEECNLGLLEFTNAFWCVQLGVC
jgi:hypothetical protein